MRNLSNNWDLLFAKDDVRLDTKAIINGVEYTAITAPVIHHSLLPSDTLTVGNCISASLTFTVMTTNVIPKSAKVVIKSRLVSGLTYTSWYEFGTFWVSKREVDDDLVTLECYDAMLKGNQVYGGSSDAMNWPKPMQTVLDTITSRMGLTLDSRTSIRSDSTTYKCEYPGEMTLLEVLGHIGACNGGNWIITPENKLRLVPLGGSGDTLNVSVVLGQITTAKSYTVSGVTMVLDEEHIYSCGNDSGYVLTINPCPYACQTIADNLYSSLRGLVYQPFSISEALYNPTAELGDTIRIGDIQSILMAETLTFDISFRADAEAPGKDEMEDEYPYPSEVIRLQQSTVKLNRRINDAIQDYTSKIEQTQQSILLSVSQTYATKTSVVEAKNVTIVSDQLHYLATSAGSGVTKNTSGWSTGVQSVTATNKYLWTYHTYTYGDNHTSDTTPVITGVYGDQGQTGPAGGTGPQGPTGTSISEVVPLYYASSSSAAPSAPTSNVTRTSTDAGYWTRSLPAVSTSYPYLYTCDQVKYSNNTYAWTTVVKDNAICDLSTRMSSAELKITDSAIISTVTNTIAGKNAVNSLIEQQADSIRLKADSISWESMYSSMSATGVLRLSASRYTNSMASVTDGDGLIIGNDGLAIIRNGNSEFSISNSYNVVADRYVQYDTQSDSDVVYVSDVDPIVQETEFTFGHETAIQPYYDIGSIEIRVKNRNLGIGGQNRDAIKITSNNTVYFAPGYGQVFVGEVLGNGSWYQVANYDLSYIFNMRQYYRVVNGLICKIDPIEDFE